VVQWKKQERRRHGECIELGLELVSTIHRIGRKIKNPNNQAATVDTRRVSQ